MAQPLSQNVPAFCLACLGTDNKFTAEHIKFDGNTFFFFFWNARRLELMLALELMVTLVNLKVCRFQIT